MIRSFVTFAFVVSFLGVASATASAQSTPAAREQRRAQFLEKHPKLAEYLKATPAEREGKLQDFLKDHPKAAAFFEKHPEMRKQAVEHPRAFRFAMRHPRQAMRLHRELQAHPEKREMLKQHLEARRAQRGR